jgi:signal transduction histidine kinase
MEGLIFLRRRLRTAAWLMAVGVFALDLRLPDGADIGLLYVLVLLPGLWMPRAGDVLRLAAFATVLSVIEYGLSPASPGHWTLNLMNHLLQGIVIWVTACGIHLFRRTLQAREAAERRAQASDARLRDQAQLAQVGKMAAVVAHEVRNPLAAIRGAVQVMSIELPPSSPEQDIAREAVARIDTLNGIVTDLLAFAKPIHPVLFPTSLGSLVHPVISLLRENSGAAGIDVEIEGEETVVPADPQLLKLVLDNLLRNSAQAMNGRGRIRVSAAPVGGACEIRIADSGPGIPASTRDHLFEPFFTTKIHGTGLGLATVRRLVQAHGGEIDLTCPPQGGTTAVLTLPYDLAGAA